MVRLMSVAREQGQEGDEAHDESSRLRIRVPGSHVQEEIGLGTLIARMTSALGIPPCGGCAERAAALDHLVVFRGSE
jgi:hypothetical protein